MSLTEDKEFAPNEAYMFEPLPPGITLWSRYQIKEFIAQGGQGSLYLAEDLRLEGRLCAIKEMIPDVGASREHQEQIQEQFHREASILARLDHPNLPKVSDFFYYNGRDYLVMDYVPGPDLRQIIERTRADSQLIPEDQVLEWADQIIDALMYLHRQDPPILHRDIKPANIKLSPDGPLKLVDFGLVKVMAPEDNRTVTVLQGKGTVQYTPLEQYGGDSGHTDVRSDIFSLGATLFHLLALQPPHEAKERFLHPGKAFSLRSLNPNISLRTEQAVLHALAMHPDERPKDMKIFKEELMGRSNFLRSPFSTERWGAELRLALLHNRVLLTVVAVLLVLALILTTFAPSIAIPR
jgi:serine/threonine-protein kinase